MTFSGYDVLQVLATLAPVLILAPILGLYIFRVVEGKVRFLAPVEKVIYRLSGVNADEKMGWKGYLACVLLFNLAGFLFLFGILSYQNLLPLNPQGLAGLSWHLAFNTAVSFVSNTNWQSYSGENTLSYFSQMLGLGVQNFLSAATGIGVLLAMTRGLSGTAREGLGNFWVDLTRVTLYVLLPLSCGLAILLMGEGVVQNFMPYLKATTLEGVEQVIALGPAASQIAIKQLGTNGGGFFNINSAHPFENPTAFSNLLQTISLILIPGALAFTFGHMIKSVKHGWVIFIVMFALLSASLGASLASEYTMAEASNGFMMEGKETRFGVANSVIWSVLTTAASNGSVNAMHSSLSPLSGGLAMLNMMLGEVIFGGVGSGLYGMLLFVLLTVFMAGLMVGRTPEYLGKKIEGQEMKWVMLGLLAPSAMVLMGTALALSVPAGLAGLMHKGPHGFSEALYALTSASNNNGSAFGGLSANTPFYNVLLGIAMLVGRYAVILPCLAIAGLLVNKKRSPATFGTFSTDTTLFAGLLIAVILIVGGLTFFPALSLGPVMEHFLVLDGRSF